VDEYQSMIGIISLTMGVSWASGINLYGAMLMLGLAGVTGNVELPAGLETLENPLVIAAAGLMYLTEFFADKIPGVDSTWDAIHTFIRIPAGAMLAMGAVGEVTPALELATAILGGSMAATIHATKAGTRLAVNTSPEPFSNWGLSLAEDAAVFAGLWAALNHPWFFIAIMVVFFALAIWLLPKIWRGIKFIFRKIGEILGLVQKAVPVDVSDQLPESTGDNTSELARLQRLLDDEAITQDEYETLKNRL